jgi:hypothetical protein
MQDDRLTPSEERLEAALGSLKPGAALVNRDSLMFAAGRASARRQHYVWQGTSVSLLVLLAVAIATRPKPIEPHVREIVAVSAQSSAAVPFTRRASEPIDETELAEFAQYVRLRRAVLERGVDALPASVVSPSTEREPPLNRSSIDDILSST